MMEYSSSLYQATLLKPYRQDGWIMKWIKAFIRAHTKWVWPEITAGVWCKLRRDPSYPQQVSSERNDYDAMHRIYQPLSSPRDIRLLRVDPGTHLDGIVAELIMFPLDDCPDFSAVSYVWGSLVGFQPLLCNGISIQTTQSAATAIRHLRSPSQPVLLWLDAVCINQMDNGEKSAQIPLMVEIYRKAFQVQIWLGEESPTSAVGMGVLESLVNPEARSESTARHWSQRSPDLVKDGLGDVLSRRWWTRGWVVQELAVSTRVVLICGHHHVSWQSQPLELRRIIREIKLAEISFEWAENGLVEHSMQVFLNLLQEQLRQCEIVAAEMDSINAPPLIQNAKPDIVDLMHDFRDKVFTDPRDRILAMLGMVPDLEYVPDYRRSVGDTWKAFREAIDAQSQGKTITHAGSTSEPGLAASTSAMTEKHPSNSQRVGGSSASRNASETASKIISESGIEPGDTIAALQAETKRLNDLVAALMRDNDGLSEVVRALWERLKEKDPGMSGNDKTNE